MPLEDVSHDTSMLSWLQQAGHGHLLNQNHQYSNISSSTSLPVLSGSRSDGDLYRNSENRIPSNAQIANFNTESRDHPQSFRQYDSSSPPPPMISAGQSNVGPYQNAYNRPRSISPPMNFNNLSYGDQYNPIASSTQFHAPHMNQCQSEVDVEQMRRDPNTRVVHRPPGDDVVYRQRVFVKYLQPPTPPVSGAIIVREKQMPAPPPEPPLIIRRAPPPPPTPPPVVIRERPPPIPPPEGTTIINKFVPPPARPPRQVIIEQYPQLPPKPRDVILEKWLPVPPRQRRIFYERLPAPAPMPPSRPLVVQHGQPNIRLQRQIITAPGSYRPYQQIVTHTDPTQVLSQIAVPQPSCGLTSSTAMISCNPYPISESCCCSISQPQSSTIVMQNGCPSTISSSSFGVPSSCMCVHNSTSGLGTYGCGVSTVPNISCAPGQSTVFSVPENAPLDGILRQLGVNVHAMHSAPDPHSAVAHVWNAAAHATEHSQAGLQHPGHYGPPPPTGVTQFSSPHFLH